MRWVYAGGASLKGASHQHNDDAIYHSENGPVSKNGAIALICDGVSSVPDGGWAAEMVRRSFEQFFSKAVDIKKKHFIDHVVAINQKIRSTPNRKGACTMVLLWIQDAKGYTFSVGDSQIGLLRHREFIVYSQDRESSGRLRYFMGMKGDIQSQIRLREFAIQDGDLILLMSDGVAEIIGSTDIFHIWKHCYEDPQLCAERLVQLAQYSGSIDDNSTVVIQYRSEED